jgi:hypothetical protein
MMKLFILKVFLAVLLITVLFSGSFLVAGALEARQGSTVVVENQVKPAEAQGQDGQSPAVSLDGQPLQSTLFGSPIR